MEENNPMYILKKYRSLVAMNPSSTQSKSRTTLKRCFDIFASAILLILFCWVFPLVWLLVRITSEGSPVYVQCRIGQFGEIFRCYKFRSMRPGTPDRGTHETPRDSVTKVGSVLRRTKMDELPQLLNVLIGDISLVGPRPCLPMQEEVIRAREQRKVFLAKPGITGLAQIRKVDMSTPVELADLDAEYINSASFSVDLKILCSTFFGRGFGDKITNDR